MDNTIGGEDVLFNYGRLTLAAPHSESNGTAGHLITESQRHRDTKTRVGKCHGYDGYIRVKKLASSGKKFGKTKNK